jgi:hypothetical protein
MRAKGTLGETSSDLGYAGLGEREREERREKRDEGSRRAVAASFCVAAACPFKHPSPPHIHTTLKKHKKGIMTIAMGGISGFKDSSAMMVYDLEKV